MKITNKSGLPEAIISAIKNDSYNRGQSDFTVTQLLRPPRAEALFQKHKHEIEEDGEDMLYRLYGQIAHGVLERANELDLVEKRFYATFLHKIVSGQIDSLSLKDGTLTDFKFSTAWGFKTNQDPKEDWVRQLNMQLEILRRNDIDAKKLQIVGLIRDFSIKSARENPDSYPQSSIVIQNIPIWPREQTTNFIEERVQAHMDASTNLPDCTPTEMWAKSDVWAVMKGARAVNGGLKGSPDLAEAMLKTTPGARIEHRAGERTRCEYYCSVSEHCDQFKKYKQGA